MMGTVFQFHKGTIKPAAALGSVGGAIQFQFHKGTIKPHERNTIFTRVIISIP